MAYTALSSVILSDHEKRAMAHAFAQKAIDAFEKKQFAETIQSRQYAIQLFQTLAGPAYMDQKLTMQCLESLEICYRITQKFDRAAKCKVEKEKLYQHLYGSAEFGTANALAANDFSDLIAAYLSEHPDVEIENTWFMMHEGVAV